ncbi:peptidase M56, BlaR1 [Clostridium aceticum]|uniref:Peptidase M56, BlaR1 n=1 Tax=Clostridium aceticum TaxID=84022 RepID=A0A0G3WCT6_9CLOT|nr:M56 family metallopeptidase [Clostridium aceticum]AKL95254.1 peptidase M56, BlaR1 [Clostridium aceticum]
MASFLQELFLSILNMSITASYVILFVIVGRLFLKKAPKIFSYASWAVVLFRLISPFSFSSAFSLLKVGTSSFGKMEYIPSNIGMMAEPQIDLGISGLNTIISNSLPAATPYASINPTQIILLSLSIIWILGVLGLMTYSLISYLILKHKVGMAVLLQDNVFECENISSPFVLGIVNPKIYLPIGLSEAEKSYILKHEQIHIKRFDYLIKPFAFLALCVHWFNPFVWLSFVLMSHDMEMACDEQVIKELGTDIKTDYSTSILSLAVNKKMINGSPLAFGEIGAKGRIKNVLNYKRSTFWVIIMAVIVVIITGIGLASNPTASTYYNKEKIHMAETWAEALNIRNGKLRYEIMSESMKEKFVTEQKEGSDSDEWNYSIGYSSPWVVNYEIDVEGDTANITYHLTDSTGEIYEKIEIITFGKENNQLVIIDAREKFAQWEKVRYFAPTAKQAMEVYRKALLESDYLTILSLVHTANFDPIGQEIWDTIKINSVKVVSEDIRENKACYELELDIKDGGNSAFEIGIFPRWLWLVKGELGWYVEGLMTSGEPDASWWSLEL